MKTIEEFIDFVIELTDEELGDYLDGDARTYFMQGGCFEFTRILKKYIKESSIVINKDSTHCGIKYLNKFYDAKGPIKEIEGFKVAGLEDIEYMEAWFGIPEKQFFKGKRISDYLIEQIEKCNIKQFIDSLEGEER